VFKSLAIHNYLEILALVVSLIFYPRLKSSSLKLLPVFFLITVIVELGSKVLKVYYDYKNTSWLYNIYIMIQISFFPLLYFFCSKEKRKKLIFKFVLFLFLIFHFINILFYQGLYNFNYISYLFGSVLVIFSSFLFFLELIDEGREVILVKLPLFWITSAAILFFTGTFFYFLFFYFLINKADINGNLFRKILTILNIFYYSFLIIGMICRGRVKK